MDAKTQLKEMTFERNDIEDIRDAMRFSVLEVIEAVKKQALGGDMSAAKLLLDRVCPTLKPESRMIKMVGRRDDYDNDQDYYEQAARAMTIAQLEASLPPDLDAPIFRTVLAMHRIAEEKKTQSSLTINMG